MAKGNASQEAAPAAGWRRVAVAGASFGVTVAVTRVMVMTLRPSVGWGWALALGLAAALVASSGTGVIASYLFGAPRDGTARRDRPESPGASSSILEP